MVRAPQATYRALRIDVTARDADAWSDALLAAGAMSVDAGDPDAGTAHETPLYEEGVGDEPAWWPVCCLVALFGPGDDPVRALASAARALQRPVPASRVDAIPDRDWVAATRAQYAPIEAAPGLWIVPSWCEPPVGDAVTVILDPGVAFGTGSHPTTRMCLAWLARTVRAGDSVLDYGCGSGILAIAAAKLGATRVEGVDVDPQAIGVSGDNARANGIAAHFHLADERRESHRTQCDLQSDVVVANILANPLRLLAPLLASRCRANGRIALAGILDAQADEVIDAYARWFTMRREEFREGWVLLAGVRACVPGVNRP
ncbi:MAG TPA: 50S ribosomal protein L11 methyltransferase [Candidatus Tumulicola sp.]|nr:50S ribosomal protein L11 methyltransferase [Candidatus Tumulicola sp.]